MVRLWDRKRVGDAATTTRGAERRGAPPSRHTFSPGDKMGQDGGGREALIGAGREAMVEEEKWAPGQVVRKVGGQDGSWLFLFPFRCDFLLFSLSVVGAYYDRLGRSGAWETVI